MKAQKLLVLLGAFTLTIFLATGCAESDVTISSSAASLVANTEAEYKVEGMHCQHGCAGTIEKSLASMSGIQDCSVNFEKGMAVVRFDNGITDSDKIIQAIEGLNDGQYKAQLSNETGLQKLDLNEDEASSTLESSINTSSSGIEVPDLFGFFQELF